MLNVFAQTFTYTALILSGLAGVCAAIAVCGAAVLVVLALLAASFDRLTDWLAKRWKRKGREPRSRVAKIIYAGREHHV